MDTPEWLSKRGGSVQPSSANNAYFVMFGDQPQYRLLPVPVRGKFGCAITQTINGKRIPSESQAATEQGAIQTGLDDLRKSLGW